MTKKTCTKCGVEKILDEFYKHPTSKGGFRSCCKLCHREEGKRWHKTTYKGKEYKRRVRRRWRETPNGKESLRNSRRKSRLKCDYGLTTEEYSVMLESQNGLCDICSTDIRGKSHVDHDHETGKTRSLLCRNCNTGIGLFGENQETLIKASEYIRTWKERK